jgi:hypothetical protein
MFYKRQFQKQAKSADRQTQTEPNCNQQAKNMGAFQAAHVYASLAVRVSHLVKWAWMSCMWDTHVGQLYFGGNCFVGHPCRTTVL